DHHALNVCRDDGQVCLGTGECADRFDRGPMRDDQELHASFRSAAQDRRADEARDLPESREGLGPEMLDVGLRMFRLREAAPMAGDHVRSWLWPMDATLPERRNCGEEMLAEHRRTGGPQLWWHRAVAGRLQNARGSRGWTANRVSRCAARRLEPGDAGMERR